MNTILVPLDGTPTAAAALPHALGFCARFGARLRLLYARDETVPERLELGPAAAGWQSWEYLTAIGKFLHAHTELISGAPSQIIVREAGSLEAGLVLMGTNSRQSGVADFVMHHAPCPVLRIHAPRLSAEESDRRLEAAVAGDYPRYRRILVPLDGTPAWERSLGPASRLCALDHGQLTLMGDTQDAILEERAGRLRALGCKVETRSGHGLEELPHDLIVVSTLEGSQLEQLVQRAPCPVLVLRGTGGWLLDLSLEPPGATPPRCEPGAEPRES